MGSVDCQMALKHFRHLFLQCDSLNDRGLDKNHMALTPQWIRAGLMEERDKRNSHSEVTVKARCQDDYCWTDTGIH